MVSICYWWIKYWTYRTGLTPNLFPDLRYIMVDVRNSYMIVHG